MPIRRRLRCLPSELGTPLTNILLNLAAHALGGKPEETKKRLALVKVELRRTGRLVANVLMLRKKIERDPANPAIIETVRGVGYRFGE